MLMREVPGLDLVVAGGISIVAVVICLKFWIFLSSAEKIFMLHESRKSNSLMSHGANVNCKKPWDLMMGASS